MVFEEVCGTFQVDEFELHKYGPSWEYVYLLM